jgi:hypothetical protein
MYQSGCHWPSSRGAGLEDLNCAGVGKSMALHSCDIDTVDKWIHIEINMEINAKI